MENVEGVYNDRLSYEIMTCMHEHNVTSQAQSYTLKEITNALLCDGNKYNIRTVSYKIKELVDLNLINPGMKKKNANTFYIGQAGLDTITELERNEVECEKPDTEDKTENELQQFLVILDMGKDYKIPLRMEAENSAEAMLKASMWCIKEGYFALGMEVTMLHKTLGIVEIR